MTIKNVLILYKKSFYSIYFEHPRSSFKKRGVAPSEVAQFKETHYKHAQCLRAVEETLKRLDVKYVKAPRGRKINFDRFDLIVTVGGDGTFMEAAQRVKSQYVLGVNSDPSWSVGRFCSATSDTFENILKNFLFGKALIQNFQRLKLQVGGREVLVLNDILVCHRNPAAMSRYYLSVGAIKEKQKSSGVWISTAAGSSGAIKSAGGKKIPSESSMIQYRPRELYRGKGVEYRLKGDVLDSQTSITIMSLMREGFVFVDGSHTFYPFDFGETIKVSRSKDPLKAVWS